MAERALRRVRHDLEEMGEGNKPLADRIKAAIRQRRDGLTPDQIAKKMRMPQEEIEFLFSQYTEEPE